MAAAASEPPQLGGWRGVAALNRAQGRKVLHSVDVDQDAGIFHLDTLRRVARHQASRALVATQSHQLRIQLGGEADRVAASTAVLGVGHGMGLQRLRHEL